MFQNTCVSQNTRVSQKKPAVNIRLTTTDAEMTIAHGEPRGVACFPHFHRWQQGVLTTENNANKKWIARTVARPDEKTKRDISRFLTSTQLQEDTIPTA
jgi:hypothetical protein